MSDRQSQENSAKALAISEAAMKGAHDPEDIWLSGAPDGAVSDLFDVLTTLLDTGLFDHAKIPTFEAVDKDIGARIAKAAVAGMALCALEMEAQAFPKGLRLYPACLIDYNGLGRKASAAQSAARFIPWHDLFAAAEEWNDPKSMVELAAALEKAAQTIRQQAGRVIAGAGQPTPPPAPAC